MVELSGSGVTVTVEVSGVAGVDGAVLLVVEFDG